MFPTTKSCFDCILSINYKIPKQIKIDVKKMTDIWKNVLIKNYSNNLRVIYVKGSSNKIWLSPIDYVPVLSDVDIHYLLKEDTNTIYDSIEKAIRISDEVQRQFREKNPRGFRYSAKSGINIILIDDIITLWNLGRKILPQQ